MPPSKKSQSAAGPLKKLIAATDPEKRIRLALEAWCVEPVARVRALVLDLAKLSSPSVPMTPRLEAKPWNELLAADKAGDLPLLAATIAQAPPGEAVRRFKKLVARGSDPRLVDVVLEWIAAAPIQTASADSKLFWKQVFGFLSTCGDLSLPARLPTLDPQGSGTTVNFLRTQVRTLIRALGSAPEPALSEQASAVLAELEVTTQKQRATQASAAASGAKSEAELLEEVYASPNDDGPRLVYADWLTQRGDPWGELIVIQIAQARGEGTSEMQTRAEKLLAAHAEARTAGLPIEWKVRHQGAIRPPVFRRGFLSSAEIWLPSLRPLTSGALAHGDPRWGTVEQLRLIAFDTPSLVAVVSDPAKRALRRVFDVWSGQLAALLPRKPASVEELGLGFMDTVPEDLRKACKLLAKAKLRAVTIECRAQHHAEVMKLAREELRGLERITVSCRSWTSPDLWRLSRLGNAVRVELNKRVPPEYAPLLHAAVAAAAGPVDELVLVSAKPLSGPAQKKALADAFGPLASRARIESV